MILSDRSIRKALDEGRIVVDPLAPDAIQPSSVDVRLDSAFRVFANHRYPHIDVREDQPDLTELVEVADGEPFILHPGEFVLGATLERIKLPDDIVSRLEGKSSLGRLGLLIHSTAGFIDAGFDGYVTLELSNVATLPDRDLPGDEGGAVRVLPARPAGGVPLRLEGDRLEVPGSAGANGLPVPPQLRALTHTSVLFLRTEMAADDPADLRVPVAPGRWGVHEEER